MARKAKYRWLNLTGGQRLPKRGRARAKAEQRQAVAVVRLNGPVTIRMATAEELARLDRPPDR